MQTIVQSFYLGGVKIMKNNFIGMLLVFFSIICFTVIAMAETIVLQPRSSGKDAHVCDCKPNETGGGNYIAYQGEWRDCYSRFLIEWDIGSLPENITITKAVMELRCCEMGGNKSGQMAFSRLIEDWSEDNVTHTTCPKHTNEDSVITDWAALNQWHAVDITKFVQLWYAERDSNYGVICHSINTTGTYWVGYFTSDYRGVYRPKLTITYSINTGVKLKKP